MNHFDLGRSPYCYVSYGVKCIDLVSLAIALQHQHTRRVDGLPRRFGVAGWIQYGMLLVTMPLVTMQRTCRVAGWIQYGMPLVTMPLVTMQRGFRVAGWIQYGMPVVTRPVVTMQIRFGVAG